MRSEGCEDRGRQRGCGKAFIKINGRDHSKSRRGYNFVVLNGQTGKVNFMLSLCHTGQFFQGTCLETLISSDIQPIPHK